MQRPLLLALALTALAPRGHAQPATFTGAVVTLGTDAPIRNATIDVDGRTARSDSAGRFRIGDIAAGVHRIRVRAVGFDSLSTTLTFAVAETVDVDLVMNRVATKLRAVDVKASPSEYAIKLADFEERRRVGAGRYLTADVFAKNTGRDVSEVLRSLIPGISTIGTGTKQVLVGRRGGSWNCPVQVILNGMTMYNGSPYQEKFDINSLYVDNVIGVEYYTVATTPLRYNATSGPQGGTSCGTVIIWTK